jgi:peptide/nickel transport system permease protein
VSVNLGEVATGEVRRRHRPSPRIAQMKRTWYFFRRNSLGMAGLIILVMIAGAALYALWSPLSWFQMDQYCSTDFGPLGEGTGWNASAHGGNFDKSSVFGCSKLVCTYEIHPPANSSDFCNNQWYPIPYASGASYPGAVAPTFNFGNFQTGPMPLGSLSIDITSKDPVFNLYSGMLRGADWSLIFSVSIVGIGALAGLMIGAISGLWGGYVDEAIMRIVDIFLSIPVILFVIVTITVVTQLANQTPILAGPDVELTMLMLAFAAVWWPFYARLVRGQVLVVREQKYVEAARAAGAGRGRIIRRHIIPNSIYPVFIQMSLDVGTIPLLTGALVYLGFKIFPSPYFPEWGAISANSVLQLQFFLNTCIQATGCVVPWWQILFPGLVLFFFAISVNFLSDGLRDALDPRLRR